jgi:hypothetical protein
MALILGHFVARHYWMHSNDMGQVIFFLTMPVCMTVGLAFLARDFISGSNPFAGDQVPLRPHLRHSEAPHE